MKRLIDEGKGYGYLVGSLGFLVDEVGVGSLEFSNEVSGRVQEFSLKGSVRLEEDL